MKNIFLKALLIVIISSIIGLAINAVNPNGVKISRTRPRKDLDDTVTRIDPDSAEHRAAEKPTHPVFVNLEQINQLVNQGKVLFLDARLPAEFARYHIPHAINIPVELLGDYLETIDSLPENKWLVCYCEGPPCDLGEALALELYDMGFPYVAIYNDGLDDWKKNKDEKR